MWTHSTSSPRHATLAGPALKASDREDDDNDDRSTVDLHLPDRLSDDDGEDALVEAEPPAATRGYSRDILSLLNPDETLGVPGGNLAPDGGRAERERESGAA